VCGGNDYTSSFKSSKKLKFEVQDKKHDESLSNSFKEVIPFNVPNDNCGNINYNEFLNKRNLNSLFETVDENMTEEDHESVSASI
jgi:hypothetical protein